MLLRFSSPALNDAASFLFVVIGVIIGVLVIRTLLEAARALRAYTSAAEPRRAITPGRA